MPPIRWLRTDAPGPLTVGWIDEVVRKALTIALGTVVPDVLGIETGAFGSGTPFGNISVHAATVFAFDVARQRAALKPCPSVRHVRAESPPEPDQQPQMSLAQITDTAHREAMKFAARREQRGAHV